MISYIHGFLADIQENKVAIDVGGLGYEVNVPATSPLFLLSEGEEVTVYTHMAVREDEVALYGFASRAELALFRKLISVSGVGAKMALAILSALPADQLVRAIVFEDAKAISAAPGVGKKTAERVVLELKDKLGDVSDLPRSNAATKTYSAEAPKTVADEAVAALLALGYSRSEAMSAVSRVQDEPKDVSAYVRLALKNL